LRLRRLCRNGRALIVPLDEGLRAGPVEGFENPLQLIKRIARSPADAVLLSPGLLEQAAAELGQLGVILRIECGAGGPLVSAADAVSLGADAVVTRATLGGEREHEELHRLARVIGQARRWNLPVVAETLPAGRPAALAAGIARAVRIAAEMGADVIAAPYTGEPESFRRLVASAGRPVLVAGGPLRDSSLRALLELVDQSLSAGAEGVMLSGGLRDPDSTLAALAALVHEDAGVESALAAAQQA